MIYAFFLRHLPPTSAAAATALVYFIVMVAIIVALPAVDLQFRYLGL